MIEITDLVIIYASKKISIGKLCSDLKNMY